MVYQCNMGKLYEMPVFIQRLFFSPAGDNLIHLTGESPFVFEVKNPIIPQYDKTELQNKVEEFFNGFQRAMGAREDFKFGEINNEVIRFEAYGAIEDILINMKIPKKQVALAYSSSIPDGKETKLYDLISNHYDDDTEIMLASKDKTFNIKCNGLEFSTHLKSIWKKTISSTMITFIATGHFI